MVDDGGRWWTMVDVGGRLWTIVAVVVDLLWRLYRGVCL
jgi:hypothetical protein